MALIASAPVGPLARLGRTLRAAAALTGLPPAPFVEPLARLRSLVEALVALPRRERLAFVARKCRLLLGWRRPADAAPPNLMAVYHRVVMRYFPRRAPGRVVLFWPEQEPWGPAGAAASVWRRLVPEVDVYVVPGDHLAVIHEHLDVLLERLAPYLEDRAPPFRTEVMVGIPFALPPLVVNLIETIERAGEMSRCLA